MDGWMDVWRCICVQAQDGPNRHPLGYSVDSDVPILNDTSTTTTTNINARPGTGSMRPRPPKPARSG